MAVIYTIGYTGSSHDDLRDFIKATSAILVDIRFSPVSRAAMWGGNAVARAVGYPNYVHLRALGNENYKNGGPVKLSNPKVGADAIGNIIVKQNRDVILMCVCHDVMSCHRTFAAHYLQRVLASLKPRIVNLPPRYSQWRDQWRDAPARSKPPVFGEADPRDYEAKPLRNNCLTKVHDNGK